MGAIRQVRKWMVIFLLVVGFAFVTACGGTESGTGQGQSDTEEPTKTDKAKDDKSKENTPGKSDKTGKEIPAELLPGNGSSEVSQQADAFRQSDAGEVFDASEEGAAPDNATGSSGGSDGGNTGNGSSNNGNSGGGINGGGSEEENIITVNFEVESSQAASYGYNVYCSESLTLEKGATVYDALAAADVGAVGSGSYIQGIGGLYERDCGSMSGWKYYVNGTAPSKGCADYTLSDGDSVQWTYTLKP